MQTEFSRTLGIEVPLICGAMYPCSNPELVAAVSEAGGIGIIQPLSLTYVHGYDFRDGLRYIRSLTSKPVGINFIIEASSKRYLQRVHQWVEIALEENIPFFVTALGNPRWVVDKARPAGVTVYHDVTNRRWAEKALQGGVDGFICVNNRAGGHAGTLSPQQLSVWAIAVPSWVRALSLPGNVMRIRIIRMLSCMPQSRTSYSAKKYQGSRLQLSEHLISIELAPKPDPLRNGC